MYKIGALAIPIFSELSDQEFKNSVTQPSLKAILEKRHALDDYNQNQNVKKEIRSTKTKRYETIFKNVLENFPIHQHRAMEVSLEKGASIWLTSIPLVDEGYVISKNIFWDLICLRYGWSLRQLPLKCECGEIFSIEHALTYKKDGFLSLRHNSLRDLKANLLNKTCKDVRVEPPLTPLTREEFNE